MADPYRPAFLKACERLLSLDPQAVAGNAEVTYIALAKESGRFTLPFFGQEYHVQRPQIAIKETASGQTPAMATQVLLLHYLVTADGAPLSGEWVSFRRLPSATIYDQAFQARALAPLAQTFGRNQEGFQQAAARLGGEPMRLGDVSAMFRLFPRLFLAVVLWLGDEELPATANILYDAAAYHYLPTEDLAVVGGMLSGRLVKAMNR